MRQLGLALAASALMLASGAAAAQNSEMETVQAMGNLLLDAHRETLQLNIDRAAAAMAAKDYGKARKFARTVVRADPKRVEAWLLLGAAQTGLEDWKGARRSYATAVRLWPGHPEARAGLGVAQAKTGDPDAAVQLAWFDSQLASCDGCHQAARFTAFRRQIELATAEGPARPL